MRTTTINRLTMLASTALGVAWSCPALAQENNADIIVTARRVEERLQDVPISITVFNQQQLTSRNVVNAGDLATYTPSLSSNGRFGAENTSFAIRGFVQDNGTAPSVAVYFADVATLRAAGGTTLGNGAGPGSFFDLSNVQVLKGAQGTLFGRNTTGGAVLLVPQKPTSRLGGYVEGSYGNYDMKRIQGVLNIPLMDSFRVRVGVDHQQRDGYLNNYSGLGPRHFADTNYTAARFSAVADLTPDLENYFIATYSNSDTNGFLPQIFTCAPSVLAGAPAPTYQANLGCAQVARQNARGDFYGVENAMAAPRQHVRQWQVINTTTWKASDTLTIKNIASYGEFREYFRSAVYGDDLLIPAGAGPNAGRALIKAATTPFPGQDSASETTATEELQLQGNLMDNRLTWQAGGYMEISDPIGFSGSASPSSAVCPTANTFECISASIPPAVSGGNITSIINQRLNKQKFRNHGLYAQATYKIAEKLSVTGGIRYTWDKTSAITRQAVYILGATPSPNPTRLCQTGAAANDCQQEFRFSSKAPTWLVDIDYKPTENMLIYAKYTRGYRAGGLKIDGGPVFNTFDPEKVDTYEGGLKASMPGALNATFNVAAFYSKFLSQQLAARLDPTPINPNQQPPQVIASGAKSRVYGVEVEASVTPFRGFTVDANYAYLNTRLNSIPPASGTSTIYFPPVATGSAPGFPLGYAPKNKYTITATYRLPVDESIGKISISGTFSHSDKQLTTAGYVIPVSVANQIIPANVYGYNPGMIPSINLVNMSANWNSLAGLPIDLSVFVTNLTQKKYTVAVFGGIGAFGYDARALGEPRMYGVRLKYRFGS